MSELIGQTELVPAVATPGSFELYKRYQISVHQDKPEKLNMRGFRRFLCDSPLIVSCVRDIHCYAHDRSS